jgi:hypothetical protein
VHARHDACAWTQDETPSNMQNQRIGTSILSLLGTVTVFNLHTCRLPSVTCYLRCNCMPEHELGSTHRVTVHDAPQRHGVCSTGQAPVRSTLQLRPSGISSPCACAHAAHQGPQRIQPVPTPLTHRPSRPEAPCMLCAAAVLPQSRGAPQHRFCAHSTRVL